MTISRTYRVIIVVLLALATFAVVCAQPRPDDQPAVTRWQERLRVADSLERRGMFAAAIDVLEELRASPIVRGRSEDYPRLLVRLAGVYALRGDADRSIQRLCEAFELGYMPAREIETSEEFSLLRSDARFVELVRMSRRQVMPWEQLLKPPRDLWQWSDTLSREMRAYGVSAIWSAVKVGYAYVERLAGRNWDSIYLATLAESMRARSTLEYYQALQRMVATLGDGHTIVLIPSALVDSVGYYPPIRTELVDGRVIVTEVVAPTGICGMVRLGDEILSIDGIPPAKYAGDRIAPWMSYSTPQDRDVRCFDHFLLAGAAQSIVQLVLRGFDGAERPCILERTYCRDELVLRPAIEFQKLPGNIGYVSINTFGDEYIVQLFDVVMHNLGNAKGLVVDLRHNTGGHSKLAFDVLARLIPGAFETHRWETPVFRGYFRARGRPVEWYGEGAGITQGFGANAFIGPVALLVGPRTLSAAEHFTAAFANARRGPIVGVPTGGSTGHSLTVELPAGGQCQITTTRDYNPDGSTFNGVGVTPTIYARCDVDDIRAGRDRALAAACRAIDSLAAPGTGVSTINGAAKE